MRGEVARAEPAVRGRSEERAPLRLGPGALGAEGGRAFEARQRQRPEQPLAGSDGPDGRRQFGGTPGTVGVFANAKDCTLGYCVYDGRRELPRSDGNGTFILNPRAGRGGRGDALTATLRDVRKA